jgi:hypothetical protein
MTTAGYSGTPLHQKLGVKPGARVLVLEEFDGFDKVVDWPEGGTVQTVAEGEYDVILAFVRSIEEVDPLFECITGHLVDRGGLWFCWPKKTSRLYRPGLTEDPIRNIGLSHGLVDNKVCAIDQDWSALRFVRRRKSEYSDRP